MYAELPCTAGQPGSGITVLLAEDDPLVARVLGDVLETEGYAVLRAPDGIAALVCARRSRFDLLLTDLDMPRLDGRELIRRLRRERPGLPVVVVTGRPPTDGGASLAAPHSAPFALLAKPFPPAALLAALRRVLAPPTSGATQAPPPDAPSARGVRSRAPH